jgi:hypothetical protein
VHKAKTEKQGEECNKREAGNPLYAMQQRMDGKKGSVPANIHIQRCNEGLGLLYIPKFENLVRK